MAAIDVDAGRRVEIRHLRGPRERKFFEAGERGLAMPPSEWPKFERKVRLRPTKPQLAKIDELKAHRDKTAIELKLDPSLIAPKATLEGLAFRPEETLAKLLPWQREVLGL